MNTCPPDRGSNESLLLLVELGDAMVGIVGAIENVIEDNNSIRELSIEKDKMDANCASIAHSS